MLRDDGSKLGAINSIEWEVESEMRHPGCPACTFPRKPIRALPDAMMEWKLSRLTMEMDPHRGLKCDPFLYTATIDCSPFPCKSSRVDLLHMHNFIVIFDRLQPFLRHLTHSYRFSATSIV